MKNPNLNKEEILSITNSALLFPFDKEQANLEYKRLAKLWHPDVNKDKDASKVFAHINSLFKQIVNFENNIWEIPGLLLIRDKHIDKSYKIKYKVTYKFEFGDMYIGNNIICYLIDNKYMKYFNNLVQKLHKIKYADKTIKSEFEKLMPDFDISFDTCDNRTGIIIKKTKEWLLLKDVLNYYDGKLNPKHVAWILSCLYNLTCFFYLNSLSHNSITIDTCFIHPEKHSVKILGGWFYATYFDKKLLAVPKKIFDIIPPDIKTKQLGNTTIDLESIKLLGRTLLDDPSGMKLNKFHSNVDPLIMWLRLPSKQNPMRDYGNYDKILIETFGPKSFTQLDLNSEMLYK